MHPKTVVDVTYPNGVRKIATEAHTVVWDGSLLFRIVTPYVEPGPKLECLVLKNDNGITADVDKDYLLYLQREDGGTIHRMIEADGQ